MPPAERGERGGTEQRTGRLSSAEWRGKVTGPISAILRKCFGSPGDFEHFRVTQGQAAAGDKRRQISRLLQTRSRALLGEGTDQPPTVSSAAGLHLAVWPECFLLSLTFLPCRQQLGSVSHWGPTDIWRGTSFCCEGLDRLTHCKTFSSLGFWSLKANNVLPPVCCNDL